MIVIKWVISLDHATRMMKKLRVKKHAGLGYYFELEELDCSLRIAALTADRVFAPYRRNAGGGRAYRLTVHRDVPTIQQSSPADTK